MSDPRDDEGRYIESINAQAEAEAEAQAYNEEMQAAEREMSTPEFIKLNPIEELLKAIEIVHGQQYADVFRQFVWKWQDQHRLDAVEWD